MDMMVSGVTFVQSVSWLFFGVATGFNLDSTHPIILVDPSVGSSQFGRSLVLYTDSDTDEKWIRVGAPMGNFSQAGSNTIQNSGLIYHCPFMEKCTLVPLQYTSNSLFSSKYKEKHDLTDSLLGSAMDIDYTSKTFVIGASNWHYFDTLDSPKIRGGIIVENMRNKTFESHAPFKGEDLISNNLPYFARAMGGFSIHITSNGEDLLLGAPGVYNFIGTVMKIKRFQQAKTAWDYYIARPQGRYNEYLGYSLTSGQFQNDGKTYYAVGIPRGQKDSPDKMKGVLLGSVAVFSISNSSAPGKANHFGTEIIRIIMGTQMGEYFGHSLAAGDLDRDGIDDLLIGAPYRQNDRDGFDHGSVYVFTKGNLMIEAAMRLDGASSSGQFGAAIMYLGDLDKDGTCEVAISAPHEDRSGVIYIYSYEKTAKRMIVTQRIAASTLHSDLRGFGMSFSKPRDIDGNFFDDIAIGAPISGHVVLLRSRPMVIVHRRLETPMFLTTADKNFTIKICFSYSDYTGSMLKIVRKLLLDEEVRRFSLLDDSLETKTITITSRREMCESLQATRTKTNKFNFKDPISVTLTYELVETENASQQTTVLITKDGIIGKDYFCQSCPVLRRKSVTTLTKQMNWDHSCKGPEGRRPCQANMGVIVNFLNLSITDTFVLGSDKSLYVNVTVWNKGDTALSPQLSIVLPDGITFRMGRVNCEDTDNNLIVCDLGENLERQVTTIFELNMNNINDVAEEGELNFFFNTSTITQNSGVIKGTNVQLKLKRISDFSITGESKEFTYSIDQNRTTSIRNILKIEKFGPSPVPVVKAFIVIPYRITGSDKNFTTSIEINSGTSTTQLIQCNRVNLEPAKRRPRLAFFGNDNNETALSSGKVLYLNCSSKIIDCEFIDCNLGPFSASIKHAEISIEMNVDFKHIEDMLNFKESIQISSKAHIAVDFPQSGNKPDTAEISNVIIIYKDYTISFWILIGSVIVGFLIVILLTICLAKAGFFKRKDHEKLKALKEELEEERLMDEMIKKEMSKDDIDEHSKFFGETIEEKDIQL